MLPHETEAVLSDAVEADSLVHSEAPSSIYSGFVDRVTKSFGALSAGAVVNVFAQIAVVPVALYAWGKFRYGEWLLLTGLVQLLKVTDLGLQTFVVNRLCASYARGDREDLERSLHSALRVQLPLALTVLAGVAAIMLALPVERILGLHTIAGRSLFSVGVLLSTELLIGVPMGVVAGVYRATGYLARSALIGAVQQFAIVVMTLLLVGNHASFPPVAAGRVAIAVVASIWIVHDLRRLHPWLEIWSDAGSWHEGLSMLVPGLFFLLIPVADYLSTQFTLAVTQRFLGGGEVARLATHRTVANLGSMVSALLTIAVWPELTALHALEQRNPLARVHRTLAKLNLWLVSAVLFGALPFLPLIYPVWTDKKLTLDVWTLGFLVVRMMFWSIWNASSTVLLATNRHRGVALILLGEALLTGALAVILVPRLGIKGAALAALIADVAISAWLIPRLALQEIGDSVNGFLATIASAMAAVVIPVAVGLVGWRLLPSTFLRYGLVMPVSGLLGVAMMVWQLNTSERRVLTDLHGRIAPKKISE